MKAKKLPSGNYRVQIYLGLDSNGKKIIKSFTAKTQWEAIRKAEEYKRTHGLDCEDLTVYECMFQYNESRRNSLAPSTIRGYEIIMNTRLQMIKDVKCKELTKNQIQFAVNADAVRLSRKSIKSALSFLKSALSMNGIDISIKGIAIPPQKDNEVELPPIDEIIKLVKGTKIELPCLLAMWLSLRISEIRGLKFRDISEDGMYISVRRTKVYINGKDVVREQTKTEKSKRTNHLPRYIYNLIQQVPHNSDDDYIVPYGYNAISGLFKRLMKSRGYDDISFHKLRHEFATTLNELHIPDEYIQKLGGWSTDNVMKTVYTHTRKPKEDEYQEIIDKHFNDIIDKP